MAAATAAAVAAVAIPAITGMIGNEAARGDRDAASRAARNAQEQIMALQIPDIEKQKLMLELPQLMGQYFPEQEVQSVLGPTAMEGVSTDPRLKDAQMKALEQLSGIGEEGLTSQDRMLLNQMRREVAGEEKARQGQILQNMASRGMGGSGTELAARLQSSQSAADRGSQEADRIASMAQQRALQGITQAGQLGGQMRTQEFGEQSDVARAKDSISQFNTQNGQQVQQRNVAARNQAAMQRLAEQQRVAEQQVAIRNQQQQQNNQLLQQQFNNQMQLAQARAGAYNQQANIANQNADATAGMWRDIGAGAGQIVGAFGSKPQTAQDKALGEFEAEVAAGPKPIQNQQYKPKQPNQLQAYTLPASINDPYRRS